MNMNQEIRAEIRTLRKAEKQINRQGREVRKQALKQIKAGQNMLRRAEKNCTREMERLTKRLAVLQGRLS